MFLRRPVRCAAMPDHPDAVAQPQEAQLRLSDYTRPVVDRFLLILAAVLVTGVATYVYYDRQPDVYSSSTSIYVTTASANPLDANVGDRRPDDAESRDAAQDRGCRAARR